MMHRKAILFSTVLLVASVLPALSQKTLTRTPATAVKSSDGVSESGTASFKYVTIVAPNASLTQPQGISNKNVVAGAYWNGINNGFLLTNGAITKVDLPASDTSLSGINSSGEIVGYYDGNNGSAASQAFALSNGKFSNLNIPNAMGSIANGISDSGSIVGQYYTATSDWQGFLYIGGATTTLNFPGAQLTVARGVNNYGQIVGVYADVFGNTYSFVYSGDSFQQLVVPGCVQSGASGINNNGDIVGFCNNSKGAGLGYLYKSGVFSFLAVPGSSGTGPTGINDAGEIVGQYSPSGSTMIDGFLAIPSN
jgi:uncharacterized membrane protein